MPTLLIYNQYFPPDTSATSALAASLTEAFTERGWAVKQLRGNPSYRPSSTQHWRFGQLVARDGDEWIVRSTAFTRDRMIGRVANYLSFVVLSFFVALRIPADLIIAMTDPPIVVMPAVVVGRLRRTPVIYWLQDYLPDFLVGTGSARHGALIRVWSRAHIAAARRCRRVVAIGRDMAARLIAAGVSGDAIAVVPNGSALVWHDEAVGSTIGNDRLVVLHAGEIGMRGAWQAIVPAAQSFADVADLVFVGDGVDAPTVRSLAGEARNVLIREPVQRAEMIDLLLSADVMIVTVRRGAEGYTVPSKTYELFGAGRPIVVVADAETEPALLVREIGCGLVVSPDAPDEFAAAVRKLAADPQLRRSMGEAARRVSPDYARRKMMNRIVDLAEDVVS